MLIDAEYRAIKQFRICVFSVFQRFSKLLGCQTQNSTMNTEQQQSVVSKLLVFILYFITML